ncbi:MAG: DUF523 domain-containing protein [Erysipelotrichaceae bacterium]|nr:DUF523 domain-containing protein [Erysipelotrichaceae bacterium]
MICMSACLAGCNCTYRGDSNLAEELKQLASNENVLLVCPEVAGGLPIPRAASEIISEDPLSIKNIKDEDVTEAFVNGAQKCAQECLDKGVKIAILKNNSPSCGVGTIYDGTFSHRIISGDGMFARILRRNGVLLYTENQLDEFLTIVKEMKEGKNYG